MHATAFGSVWQGCLTSTKFSNEHFGRSIYDPGLACVRAAGPNPPILASDLVCQPALDPSRCRREIEGNSIATIAEKCDLDLSCTAGWLSLQSVAMRSTPPLSGVPECNAQCRIMRHVFSRWSEGSGSAVIPCLNQRYLG